MFMNNHLSCLSRVEKVCKCCSCSSDFWDIDQLTLNGIRLQPCKQKLGKFIITWKYLTLNVHGLELGVKHSC